MENTLRRDIMKEYSRKFAEEVSGKFFADHDKLESKDVMKAQKIRQVNLFVVKNLYDQWQREADRLKSPYFNYTSSEVQEAMQNFMNTLSHHIALDRTTYLELLEKSTEETLVLIFTPYDFFLRLLKDYDHNDIPVKYLSYVRKYIKINPFLLQHLLDILDEQGKSEINKNEIQEWLDKALERTNESPEDVEPYLAQFSEIQPLTLEEIYGDERDRNKVKKENDKPDKQEEKKSMHKPTLNDLLQKDEVPTLADLHRKAKIEDIKENLSINQRYMFVNNLFNGSEEAFNRTIEHIESVATSEEAISFLTHKFSNWDHESQEVAEFLDLVKRRHTSG
jgi:hypothetical protein